MTKGQTTTKKPPTRDGLVGLLLRVSGRAFFVLTRRNVLVLTQTLSHDDANSPKKNKLRSLRRNPYLAKAK